MSDDSTVVELSAHRPQDGDDEPTLERVFSQCGHPRFTVDDKLGEVECAVCHAKLNPMWVLAQLAIHESSLMQRRNRLRKVVEQLAQRVRYKCRSCGATNDMARIVRVRPDY